MSKINDNMTFFLWSCIILILLYACLSTGWQAIEKHHRKQDIHICFYKGGALARTTHGNKDMLVNKKIADEIMKEGKYDLWEVDGK